MHRYMPLCYAFSRSGFTTTFFFALLYIKLKTSFYKEKNLDFSSLQCLWKVFRNTYSSSERRFDFCIHFCFIFMYNKDKFLL